jgi:hypothetical protein
LAAVGVAIRRTPSTQRWPIASAASTASIAMCVASPASSSFATSSCSPSRSANAIIIHVPTCCTTWPPITGRDSSVIAAPTFSSTAIMSG